MKICVISPGYPDHKTSECVFVAQLVEEMARLGNECYVIAPYSITRNRSFCKKKEVSQIGKGSITIIRPNYISVANVKIGGRSLSDIFHYRAVKRAFKEIPSDIECIYGHFWHSAIEGYEYAKAHNIPLFVATGESVISSYIVGEKYKEFYKYVSGVICVSSKNRTESIEKGLTVPEKCIVIPNSINPTVFHPKDKSKCRQLLGISDNAFVVVSVGGFTERKGLNRVAAALNQLANDSIYSMFIGYGKSEPICDNILFKGTLSHNEVVTYLNAADVFVLPTLQEGCCNAIVEAMACGLPIISSNRAFNFDILNEENSIMIDPQDINQIAEAIRTLYVDVDKRQKLSDGSLKMATNLKIENRAKRICDFITYHING